LWQRDLDISGVLQSYIDNGPTPTFDATGAYIFRTVITQGQSAQFIPFPVSLGAAPRVFASVGNDQYNTVLPFQVSGVISTGYWLLFANDVPNTGYYVETLSTTAQTGFAISVINQTTIITGEPGAGASSNTQVLINANDTISGTPNLTWNNPAKSLNIGQATILTDNPLAVAGSGGFIQINVQNKSNLSGASSDIVATADNGTDLVNYIDVGINSSTYNQTGYSNTGPNDAYVYSNGGHLVIGTQTPGKIVKIHAGGTTSGEIEAIITNSGIDLPYGGTYRIGGRDIVQPLYVPLVSSAVTATNATLAVQFFANSFGYTTYLDLSNYTGIRFVVNKAGTAGAANSAVFVRYLGHASTTASQYLPITSPEMRVPTNVQNTIWRSGYLPLVAGARSGVYVSFIASGGDGALDPIFGNSYVSFL